MSEISTPAQDEKSQLDVLMTGCLQVREKLTHLSSTATTADPQDLQEHLQQARTAVDKLETAMVYAMRLEQRARDHVEVCKASVEEHEISALPNVNIEWASAREKGVMLNLHTIDQRRDLREAERNHAVINHTLDVIKLLHRGADATRRDFEVRLRAISLTTSLER